MKTTPLYDLQSQIGARMTEFHGWDLPLSYGSILNEVRAVRQRAGLFDVSHMGRLAVSGDGATSLLQHLTTNDVGRLEVGRGHYNLICNEKGGIVDDLTIFRNGIDAYLLIVNAANTAKDLSWISSHAGDEVTIEDLTTKTILLALQGPNSQDVLRVAKGSAVSEVSRFACTAMRIAGADCSVCRAGYTGEAGYEIRSAAANAVSIWESLMVAGPVAGVTPCGLGTRDVLRLEAGYVLYGSEINEDIDPIRAGLSRFVRMEKGDFIGREALKYVLEAGSGLSLCGIRMADGSVPRAGAIVTVGGKTIGSITSGTFSPTISRGIGLAYTDSEMNQPGLEVEVILREKPHKGLIVKPPFY